MVVGGFDDEEGFVGVKPGWLVERTRRDRDVVGFVVGPPEQRRAAVVAKAVVDRWGATPPLERVFRFEIDGA